MDLLTIFGLILGSASVYYVMADAGIAQLLFNKMAFILVVGGTVASTIITYPWSVIRRVPRAVLLTIFPQKQKAPAAVIGQLVSLAEKVKRGNLDMLEQEIPTVQDRFLADGLKMVMNSLDPDLIRENLEKEIAFTRVRHQQIAGVFRAMGTYSPVFGLLGTLIGVVQILQNITDPRSLGASMAIAVTTTFYGIFGANFIALPLAGKLTAYSDAEMLLKEVVIEGVLSIQAREVPAIVSLKLQAYLSNRIREARGPAAQVELAVR